MRKILYGWLWLALFTGAISAQTADEIIGKYVKAIGGIEKIQAIKSIRWTGKFIGGGGFEAVVGIESKRPNLVRQEFIIQGLTGVNAYDGKTGWKIEPWQGKKDVETLSEEEMKDILDSADFDGPLIDYAQKGHKAEYLGVEQIEGSDTYKLKLTKANGDVVFYYLDTDYFVPLKTETKRIIRGAEIEFEQGFGDYKEVNGVYFPFSIENGVKGNPNTSKIVFSKAEANVTLDDNRFIAPKTGKQ